MAIAATNRLVNGTTSGGTAKTTASANATQGALSLLTLALERTDSVTPLELLANAGSITGTNGYNGAGWTLIGSMPSDTAGAGRRVGWLYAGVPVSSVAGTITFNLPYTAGAFVWVVDEITGLDTPAYRNVVTAGAGEGAGGAGDTTRGCTLAAFASSLNATYASTMVAGSGTITPKTGWTELADFTNSQLWVETQWLNANDTTPSSTLSASPFGSHITGLELVSTAAPASSRVLVASGAVGRAGSW